MACRGRRCLGRARRGRRAPRRRGRQPQRGPRCGGRSRGARGPRGRARRAAAAPSAGGAAAPGSTARLRGTPGIVIHNLGYRTASIRKGYSSWGHALSGLPLKKTCIWGCGHTICQSARNLSRGAKMLVYLFACFACGRVLESTGPPAHAWRTAWHDLHISQLV